MEQEKLAPNEPTGYDEARVARLQPLRDAIERLPIPLLRSRKIGGILNALGMQIEDGGDSPAVNRLLLEALRAAIRHQVDERQGRVALQAVDAFELAEAKRGDAAKPGVSLTPPPSAVALEPTTASLPAFLAKALRLPTGSPGAAGKAEPAPAGNTDAAPGKNLDAAPARRPGRNAPCWCGSGKKYKKCHLQADEEASRR